MTIRLSDGRLLAALVDALRALGCDVAAVDSERCRVSWVEADDPRQAYLELRFFARAWADRHGAAADVELDPAGVSAAT